MEDRAGETTIYDENLRPVRDGLADPYAAFGSADGDVVNLSTGETILSGYQFGAELGGGLLSVTDGSYLLGVCDLSGRMLTDCRYDRVFAADANGDVRVERDERFGLIDREGNEVVPDVYKRQRPQGARAGRGAAAPPLGRRPLRPPRRRDLPRF